jgi:hypothetical protein
MNSDTPIDDPFDGIDLNNLDGWIRYDSSGMRKKDNGEGLGGDQGDRRQNSWVRLGDG